MILLPKGKIAITPIFDPKVSRGGLFIPDQAQERCDQGIVKYVHTDEDTFEIGDYVLFSAYDGTLVSLEDEGLLIFLKSDSLVCKISPPEYLNTVIQGLYFRSEEFSVDATVSDIMNHVDNLYHYNKDELKNHIRRCIVSRETDTYFPANYEQGIELMSRTLTDLRYPQKFRFRDRKESAPKTEEIKQYGRN